MESKVVAEKRSVAPLGGLEHPKATHFGKKGKSGLGEVDTKPFKGRNGKIRLQQTLRRKEREILKSPQHGGKRNEGELTSIAPPWGVSYQG